MNYRERIYKLRIFSRAFLDRAKEQLQRFDEGEVIAIFYAALELRFGIEARLNEYIKAAKKEIRPKVPETDFIATKLLKKLKRIDENADMPATINIVNEKSNEGLQMAFTPVTTKLAKMHGQLGEMLHYKFFSKNPHWKGKAKLNPQYRSLDDFREKLSEVVDELSEANRGMLLTHPTFTKMIIEASKDD